MDCWGGAFSFQGFDIDNYVKVPPGLASVLNQTVLCFPETGRESEHAGRGWCVMVHLDIHVQGLTSIRKVDPFACMGRNYLAEVVHCVHVVDVEVLNICRSAGLAVHQANGHCNASHVKRLHSVS